MKLFEANNTYKQIDGTMILQDVSISFSKGERVAITGPNGSGKRSLLKLIGGIYEPTSGQVNRTHLEIGYVPEHFPEIVRFKIQEYLLLIRKMSGKFVGDQYLLKKIAIGAEHFAITDYLATPLKKCSKGTKQKVGILQAFLIEPDLLLMDEPLTGLDDKAQTELLQQLHSFDKDMTIIFTAHDALLIEEIADRVIRVESGQ